MTQAAVARKKYTYQDYLKTPDDQRYELIEGELFMTPAPKIWHQRISGKLEYNQRDSMGGTKKPKMETTTEAVPRNVLISGSYAYKSRGS